METEEVSHVPNLLVIGDPIIDLVVALTAGAAAEDILREIKGEAFERTSTVCNCSTGHTLPIYVSGRTMNPPVLTIPLARRSGPKHRKSPRGCSASSGPLSKRWWSPP